MSSNKTIIPGMENPFEDNKNDFTNKSQINSGTCVPNPFSQIPSQAVVSNQKPIVGFLYSISKTSSAEFWPLRIGPNSVGRSTDNDVCLSEATVSDHHADIVIRQMKNPEKIIASVCDSRSTCGTMINGESLGFEQKECFNGDIITIGEHYDLYFTLIDARQIGLNTCRDFIPVEQTTKNTNPYSSTKLTNRTKGFDDPMEYNNDNNNEDNLEIKPATKRGGTIFM